MARVAALELSDLLFQGAAGGVLGTGVLVLGAFPEPVLHVGGGLVDGHADRSGARIGFLAGVDGTGREAEIFGIAFHGGDSISGRGRKG